MVSLSIYGFMTLSFCKLLIVEIRSLERTKRTNDYLLFIFEKQKITKFVALQTLFNIIKDKNFYSLLEIFPRALPKIKNTIEILLTLFLFLFRHRIKSL